MIPIVQLDFRKICLPHPSTTASLTFLPSLTDFCKLVKLGSHYVKCFVDSFCPQSNLAKKKLPSVTHDAFPSHIPKLNIQDLNSLKKRR